MGNPGIVTEKMGSPVDRPGGIEQGIFPDQRGLRQGRKQGGLQRLLRLAEIKAHGHLFAYPAGDLDEFFKRPVLHRASAAGMNHQAPFAFDHAEIQLGHGMLRIDRVGLQRFHEKLRRMWSHVFPGMTTIQDLSRPVGNQVAAQELIGVVEIRDDKIKRAVIRLIGGRETSLWDEEPGHP